MHIALNAHLLSLSQSYRSAGISWYIYNLLTQLAEVAPHHHYTVLVGDRAFREPRLTVNYSRWPTQRPARRIVWEQTIQPLALARLKPDLLHAMAFVSPLLNPVPAVITVYDLSFLRFPDAFRPVNRWYLRQMTTHSVKRAQAVLAISESTRQDVINLLGKSPDQVHTIHCGVDQTFQPLPADQIAQFKQEKQLPDSFVLYLGTLEPRKNIDGLIRAYAQWREQQPDAPPLVIAGAKGWYYAQIFDLVEQLNLTETVRFTGYVPQAELPLWYNAASLFVYPSHFEGFGLPVLEAMACGTPVITSNVSSLPEVAGQAGVLISPNDTEQIAEAMGRVMGDLDLQAELQERGLAHSQTFSWAKTARETVAVYEQVKTK